MPTFTTLAKLNLHLFGSTASTAEDAKLTQLITEVEASVLRYLKRGPFASTSFTEYYDGSGRESLILRHRPVTAVSSVRVDAAGYAGQGTDAFPASSEWVAGTDYFNPTVAAYENNAGILIAIGTLQKWPEGRGNIKVAYTAGYVTIPDDLTLAVNQLVAAIRAGADKGGPVASETFGEYSYSLMRGGDLASLGMDAVNAGRILAGYREVCL